MPISAVVIWWYLVVFPERFRLLVDDKASFGPVHMILIPNNITMGGNAIGIYTTPWTRFPLKQPLDGS